MKKSREDNHILNITCIFSIIGVIVNIMLLIVLINK